MGKVPEEEHCERSVRDGRERGLVVEGERVRVGR